MDKNPFAIRKSPAQVITAQALALDDYVMRADETVGIPRGGRIHIRKPGMESGGDAGPVRSCSTIF